MNTEKFFHKIPCFHDETPTKGRSRRRIPQHNKSYMENPQSISSYIEKRLKEYYQRQGKDKDANIPMLFQYCP